MLRADTVMKPSRADAIMRRPSKRKYPMTDEEFQDALNRILFNSQMTNQQKDAAIDALYDQRDQEEEEEEELWQQANDSHDDTSDSGYYPSDGSSIVDYETYSEADPDDFDILEVDGGPDENEDEFFETGDDPDDDDFY